MADIENRLPGRMLLVWVAKPLARQSLCVLCGLEQAIAQWAQLLPPVAPPMTADVHASDAMYEAWLQEQLAGVVRVGGFEAIGPTCLAQPAAQYMLQPAIAPDFQQFLQSEPFPDQVLGAMAVEPGVVGKTYPKVLGIPEPLSLRDVILVLNAPFDALDASDEVIPLRDDRP